MAIMETFGASLGEADPAVDAEGEGPAPARVQSIGEIARLKSLQRLAILDTPPDPMFDRIAELALHSLGGMAAGVSFLDRDRQWFKAVCGLVMSEVRRAEAFCAHTLEGEGLLVVEDARADPRFRRNPFVTGPFGLRFYAGAPVRAPDGVKVGSVCVVGDRPRTLSPAERVLLRLVADLAEDALRLHVAQDRMGDLVAEKGRHLAFLELKKRQLAQAEAMAELGVFAFDAATGNACFSDIVHRLMDKESGGRLTFAEFLARFPAEDRERLMAAIAGRGDANLAVERPILTAAGETRWLRVSAEVLSGPGGEAKLVGTVQNVTEQRRHVDEIAFLRRHDPLTGLLNRAGLDEALAATLASREGDDDRVGLFLIDLDDFIGINDRFGRAAGDAVLKRVAERLGRAVRRQDTVARVGSDEFALVLSGVRSERDMANVRRRVVAALDLSTEIGGDLVRVTSSVGFAIAPDDVSGGMDLFQAAESALHEARRAGAGRMRRFEPAVKESRDRYRLFVEEVRRGLRQNQFVTFLQPKVRLSDGELVGFEALLRWMHPERGVLGPHFFLEALDDPDIGGELSDVTFAATFEIAGSFRRRGIDLDHFAINLNSVQLARPAIVDEALALARIHGVPPAAILFEVVENVLIRDRPEVQDNLRGLAEAGFGISLDDFGTGYASLTNIREPFIREVKIDRSFVLRATSSEHDMQIVSAIVNMGRNMGLSVVAEGVETDGHAAMLREHGCMVGQGYLFSPPVTVTEAVRYALRHLGLDEAAAA